MASDPIKDWLHKTNLAAIQVNLLGAAGFFAAALFLLGITFFILYVFAGVLTQSETARLILAAFGVGGVFLANSMFGTAPARPGAAALPANSKSAGQNQNTDSLQTFIRMAMALIFCGPKAAQAGFAMLSKIQRLKKMDYDGCTLVLLLLLSRDSRIPYSEIKTRIPRLDTLTVFGQLEDIDGILFLDSDPPGLSLSEALRREISIFKR